MTKFTLPECADAISEFEYVNSEYPEAAVQVQKDYPLLCVITVQELIKDDGNDKQQDPETDGKLPKSFKQDSADIRRKLFIVGDISTTINSEPSST